MAYAAKDGTTASDGTGRRHSPFTEALLRHIAAPNLKVRLMFGRVRDDVLELTRHQVEPQQPYLYGALGGRSHYLQAAAGGEDAEAQRLQEQERELVRAIAAAKTAEAERRSRAAP